jgi:hypothetical protein
MAYTRQHLEALQAALAKGEHRVAFDGKVVEYRSVVELKAAIREIEAALRKTNLGRGLGAPITRQIRVTTTKGF